MNIFFLDRDPKKCAEYHCDKHCVAMIKEYCQILSTAHRLYGCSQANLEAKNYTIFYDDIVDKLLLKATHIGNRTVAWVMKSKKNYSWLASVLMYLSFEYTRRYGRIHKYKSNGLIDFLWYSTPAINDFDKITSTYLHSDVSIEDFDSLVEPQSYVLFDPVTSYRNCYLNEKRYFVKYKTGNVPDWFKQGIDKMEQENFDDDEQEKAWFLFTEKWPPDDDTEIILRKRFHEFETGNEAEIHTPANEIWFDIDVDNIYDFEWSFNLNMEKKL